MSSDRSLEISRGIVELDRLWSRLVDKSSEVESAIESLLRVELNALTSIFQRFRHFKGIDICARADSTCVGVKFRPDYSIDRFGIVIVSGGTIYVYDFVYRNLNTYGYKVVYGLDIDSIRETKCIRAIPLQYADPVKILYLITRVLHYLADLKEKLARYGTLRAETLRAYRLHVITVRDLLRTIREELLKMEKVIETIC